MVIRVRPEVVLKVKIDQLLTKGSNSNNRYQIAESYCQESDDQYGLIPTICIVRILTRKSMNNNNNINK